MVDRRNDEVVTEPDGTETSQTTTSDVTVLEVLAPASLGTTIEAPEAVAIAQPEPGELIQVVQMGWIEMAEAPAPLLASGETYLVFLSAPSDRHGAWWVTGANAGIFRPDGDVFVQVAEDTGDSFRATITREDLR
ncbi:hypothetical protein EDD28_1708 [Salana multivorans]|uniref:Uncharacterized protein n=1 Tax=Salana multivorans TaxID=120377 RepID=A0A3N2DBD6_9MICO|nr:hypothetical protein [Salana multivorans]ROR97115.1 hypothetical protein EDD28_1708 [Salana multivorans]